VDEGYGTLCVQYVTLAQSQNVPLITEDRKLHKAAPGMAFSMQEFLVQ